MRSKKFIQTSLHQLAQAIAITLYIKNGFLQNAMSHLLQRTMFEEILTPRLWVIAIVFAAYRSNHFLPTQLGFRDLDEALISLL